MSVTRDGTFWYVLDADGKCIATFRSLLQLAKQIPFLEKIAKEAK